MNEYIKRFSLVFIAILFGFGVLWLSSIRDGARMIKYDACYEQYNQQYIRGEYFERFFKNCMN